MPDTLVARGTATAPDMSDECTALESRADIASLEVLHTLRRTLVAQNAGLMARYGNFGLADDFRKRMLECAKVRIALKYADTVKKPTETAVAAEAYASDEYGTSSWTTRWTRRSNT